MLAEDLDATTTAYCLGDNDAAHFNREYKKNVLSKENPTVFTTTIYGQSGQRILLVRNHASRLIDGCDSATSTWLDDIEGMP